MTVSELQWAIGNLSAAKPPVIISYFAMGVVSGGAALMIPYASFMYLSAMIS